MTDLPSWADNILSALSSAGITFWFTRRKQNAEVANSELLNTEQAIKIWREMAQEMTEKVKELSEKVDALTAEVHNLRAENSRLKNNQKPNAEPRPKNSRKDIEPPSEIEGGYLPNIQ
jgi:peptidoglycan hydrolase CwlO-like protein